jgi:hypothetical protein
MTSLLGKEVVGGKRQDGLKESFEDFKSDQPTNEKRRI